jgi:hypothetical protein
MKKIDLRKQRFGKWIVECEAPYERGKNSRWWCVCDCGERRIVLASSLTRGVSRSCGCDKGNLISRAKFRHGLAPSKANGHKQQVEYYLFHGAKARARRKGLDFDIVLSDIVIPKRCPLLQIELHRNQASEPSSPSLDRKDSSLGYVKGNVWVISHRANTIKNDASLEELTAIGARAEKILAEGRAA